MNCEAAIETRPRYHFAELSPDKRLPNLKGWYLRVAKEDVETFFAIHQAMAVRLYRKFILDPHLYGADGKPRSELASILNVPKLGAQWCETAERLLAAGGHIWVNIAGGMVPADGVLVHRTVESHDMQWPHVYADEVITLSQYPPPARHWYLASNKERLFVPVKHDTYEAAYQHALAFVDAERIKVPPREMRQGDGD